MLGKPKVTQSSMTVTGDENAGYWNSDMPGTEILKMPGTDIMPGTEKLPHRTLRHGYCDFWRL